jgi:C4-type Zn-finger protein
MNFFERHHDPVCKSRFRHVGVKLSLPFFAEVIGMTLPSLLKCCVRLPNIALLCDCVKEDVNEVSSSLIVKVAQIELG